MSECLLLHRLQAKFTRTAELSAGLICICLPTLPALLRLGRGSKKAKVPGTNSYSRHKRTFTRKQNLSLSDQEPFSRVSLELNEGASYNATETLPTTMVTDIEGGVPEAVHARESFNPASNKDGFVPRPAILKTVKVEQVHGSLH